jgi:putative ABC transport system permease protein
MTLEGLGHDFRQACGGLWRAKAFSAVAILTLGIGLGGATIILALVQGVLLRPLPVRDQEHLIVAWKELKSSGYAHYPFGEDAVESVGKNSRLLESVAGVTTNGVSQLAATDDTAAAYVMGALVTGRFFDVLGITPLLGRAIGPSDDIEGSENVLVISAGLWRRRYGEARDVIGRRLRLGEQSFTIVGVMPPDIDYPPGSEVWRSTRSVPTSQQFGDAARQEIDLVARLRPGATIDQATSELQSLTADFEAHQPPGATRGLTPVVRSFEDVMVGNARPVMLALMVAVAMVLSIASANVANLLLLRGEGRRAELALRAALGASRARVVSQSLIESAVLSVLATLVGLAITWWSLQGLITLVPDGLPRIESIRIDGMVVAMLTTVAFVTTLLAGLAPAFLSTRIDLVSELQVGGRGATGPAARRGRRALVVAQVALAVAVVAAAGLLTRSVLRLQSVDTGVAADRLVFVSLELPKLKYADQSRLALFLSAIVESLEGVHGIDAATPVNIQPFSGGWGVPKFAAEGQADAQAAANPALNLEAVHDNYFKTLGVPIVRGRAFTAADRRGALDVAIISEDVALRTWPGEDPVGKRLKWGSSGSREPWLTVVGIAAPVRYRVLAAPQPTIYVPAVQFIVAAQTLAVRTTLPLDLVASTARERVRAIDSEGQVMRVVPFSRLIDAPMARPRFNAFLLGIFGVAALLLAAIGHYAVLAAFVRQREREIAVRVALGATAGNIGRLVMRETFGLAGIGAAVGLVATAVATRVLQDLLFEVDVLDPLSLAGAALLLIAASALASWWPVRRATRIDTLATLRA